MTSYYLKTEIGSIVTRYKLFKIRLLHKGDLTKKQIKEYEEYTRKFDACLEALEQNKKTAFQIGFMADEFNWWDMNYSLSQFYRLRRAGGIEFLELFTKN